MDGEFLKWGLTLGSMVIHILQEHSQVVHFLNPRASPSACSVDLSCQAIGSKAFRMRPRPPPANQWRKQRHGVENQHARVRFELFLILSKALGLNYLNLNGNSAGARAVVGGVLVLAMVSHQDNEPVHPLLLIVQRPQEANLP